MTLFRIVKHCLLAKKVVYRHIVLSRLCPIYYRAEWLTRTDITAKLRSRKGSVKTIVQFVAELLLRCDI